MGPDEVVLREWYAAIRYTSMSDKLVLTNHRLMGFRTKGILRPVLSELIPGWMFQLEEIGALVIKELGRHYHLFIQGKAVQILMADPLDAAGDIETARRNRLSSLGLGQARQK